MKLFLPFSFDSGYFLFLLVLLSWSTCCLSEIIVLNCVVNDPEGNSNFYIDNTTLYKRGDCDLETSFKLDHGTFGVTKVDSEAFKNMMSLTSLEISRNELLSLEFLNFNHSMHLPSLKTLKLQHNSLTGFPALFSFAWLPYESDIDLSYNSITELPSRLFGANFLNRVDFNYNKIDHIASDIFSQPIQVLSQGFQLQGNNITEIQPGTFFNFQSGIINLAGNRLTSLHQNTFYNNDTYFRYLDNEMASTVIRIDLQNNYNLSCCSLDGLKNDFHPDATVVFTGGSPSGFSCFDEVKNEQNEIAAVSQLEVTCISDRPPNVDDFLITLGKEALACFYLTGNETEPWNCTLNRRHDLDYCSTFTSFNYGLTHENITSIYNISHVNPTAFENMSKLREIILSDTYISNLQFLTRNTTNGTQLLDLPALTHLQLSRNSLTDFPFPNFTFNGFSALQIINLEGNSMRKLPNNIFFGMQQLKAIMLSNMKLTDLEFLNDFFLSLPELETLDLSNNLISEFPVPDFSLSAALTFTFEKFPRLNILYMQHNLLTALTHNLLGHLYLKQAFFNNNQITDLSSSLFPDQIQFDTTEDNLGLRLDHNPIKKLLPGTFAKLTHGRVDLSHCQLSSIPVGTFYYEQYYRANGIPYETSLWFSFAGNPLDCCDMMGFEGVNKNAIFNLTLEVIYEQDEQNRFLGYTSSNSGSFTCTKSTDGYNDGLTTINEKELMTTRDLLCCKDPYYYNETSKGCQQCKEAPTVTVGCGVIDTTRCIAGTSYLSCSECFLAPIEFELTSNGTCSLVETAPPAPSNSKSKSDIGLIASLISVLVFSAIAMLLGFFFYRRRQRLKIEALYGMSAKQFVMGGNGIASDMVSDEEYYNRKLARQNMTNRGDIVNPVNRVIIADHNYHNCNISNSNVNELYSPVIIRRNENNLSSMSIAIDGLHTIDNIDSVLQDTDNADGYLEPRSLHADVNYALPPPEELPRGPSTVTAIPTTTSAATVTEISGYAQPQTFNISAMSVDYFASRGLDDGGANVAGSGEVCDSHDITDEHRIIVVNGDEYDDPDISE